MVMFCAVTLAPLLTESLDLLGDPERDRFLVDAAQADRAGVDTAMARIDYDDRGMRKNASGDNEREQPTK